MPNCCINQHSNPQGRIWCMECSSLVEGALIHDCSVVSYLGQGSFSTVYLARQHSLNSRRVVIKVLRHTGSQPSIADFRREAAVLAALSHTYILPIYAYGVIDERQARAVSYAPYLVLPYSEQGSLEDAFVREGGQPWPITRVLPMIQEVADALDYAHKLGVLHRDIKPANLLLMGTHVVLADFGVASLIDAEVSHVDAAWAGSPAYMAPEVWRYRPGRYSDQYALAVTCYRLLTGELLWANIGNGSPQHWTHLHCSVPPRPLHTLRPDLPTAVELVLQRALAKDPHERYRDVAAFANDLRVASQDVTQSLRLHSRPAGVSKPPEVGQVRPAPLAVSLKDEQQRTHRSPARVPVTDDPLLPPTKPFTPRHRKVVDTITGPLMSFRENERWPWLALVLNVCICIVLAVQGVWQTGQLTVAANLLLTIWPALLIGPLAARWFRHISLTTISWGIFWGMLFGVLDVLLSGLVSFVWTVLLLLIPHWGHDWKYPGDGWHILLLEAYGLVPPALTLLLLSLWVGVVGGSLIGLFHVRRKDS